MNFVQKLRWETGRILLREEMRSMKRTPAARGMAEALSIGILYDAGVKENYEAVKNFVRRNRSDQKEVKSLGFINSRKLPGDQFVKLGMDFFTLTDLNWYYKPVGKVTGNFMKEKFDILINFSVDESLPLEYLTAHSAAKFRIGKFSLRNKFFFDFMVDLKKEDSMTEFVKQVEHYLTVIKSKE